MIVMLQYKRTEVGGVLIALSIMPSQQKVLFLESRQGPLAVRTTDVPSPGSGELLVKVEAAALNPIDWMIQAFGVFVETYPAIIGSDGAGTVVEIGEGVTSFVAGDRVYVAPSLS